MRRRRKARRDDEREVEASAVGGAEVDWVIVVVAGGTEKREAIHPRGGDGVVEDAKDGVGGGRAGLAGELRPVGTADGASDAAMADIGGDTREMESVTALSGEDGLAAALAVAGGGDGEELQAYRTKTLQSNIQKHIFNILQKKNLTLKATFNYTA